MFAPRADGDVAPKTIVLDRVVWRALKRAPET